MEELAHDAGGTVLRISGTRDVHLMVRFVLTVPDHPQPVELGRVPAHELGLSEPPRRGEVDGTLPETLGKRLAKALDKANAPYLWIQFRGAIGNLDLPPWERWLSAYTGTRPILRLARNPIPLLSTPNHLEIALAGSGPLAKRSYGPSERLAEIANEILDATSGRARIHVFGDQEAHPRLVQSIGDHPDIVVHDPGQIANLPVPPRRRQIVEDTSSPWLQWIDRATAHLPLDAVHLVGHGFLSGSDGAWAVAESPSVNRDRSWSRFVGSFELTRFLERRSVALLTVSAAPDNFSTPGLRRLLQGVSDRRRGVVALHEIQDRPEPTTEVNALYRWFYGGAPWEPSPIAVTTAPRPPGAQVGLEALTPQTWPAPVMRNVSGDAFARFRAQARPTEKVAAVLRDSGRSDGRRSAWVAKAQRKMEESAGNLLRQPRSELEEAAHRGEEAALEFMRGFVEHAASQQIADPAEDMEFDELFGAEPEPLDWEPPSWEVE